MSQESSKSLLQTANSQLAKTRLGQISFINCLPIVLPLHNQLIRIDASTVLEPPSKLNAMFAAGQLDVSAMSSFSYLEQPGLQLLPNVSISCTGPVGSVLFFSKVALSKLTPSHTILGSALSATSINLFKVLMHKHHRWLPSLVSDALPDLTKDDVDGAVVIGDRALEVDVDWSQRYQRVDLGQWWVETFARPMVFGVWAAKTEWAKQHSYAYAQIAQALEAAKQLGLSQHFDAVLAEGQRRTGLSAPRLTKYYRQELNFDLTAEHLEGLALYRSHCANLQLLP